MMSLDNVSDFDEENSFEMDEGDSQSHTPILTSDEEMPNSQDLAFIDDSEIISDYPSSPYTQFSTPILSPISLNSSYDFEDRENSQDINHENLENEEELEIEKLGFKIKHLQTEKLPNPDGYLTDDIYKEGCLNIVKAPMGIGKTQAAKKFLANLKQEKNNHRALCITNRISLSYETASVFDADNYKIIDPLEYFGSHSRKDYVICVNSLNKIDNLDFFETIVFDELSGTINNILDLVPMFQRNELIKKVRNLLDPASRGKHFHRRTILVMDATLSIREYKFIHSILLDECKHVNCISYIPTFLNCPSTVFYDNGNLIKLLFKDALFSKKKIAIATSARDYVSRLLKLIHLRSSYLGVELGIYEEPTRHPKILWIDKDIDRTKLSSLMNDQDQLLEYDIVAYSPVILSGVSITVKGFDVLYVLGCYGTVDSSGIVQMMRRMRNIGEEGILISAVGKPIEFDDEINIEVVKNHLKHFHELDEKKINLYKDILGSDEETITRYFNVAPPEYVFDLIAYYITDQLHVRCSFFNAVSESMKLNHPDWELQLFPGESIKTISTKDLGELLERHSAEIGDIISSKLGDILCRDVNTFKDKAGKYRIFGLSNDSENLSLNQDIVKSCLQLINPATVHNFNSVFGPFSFVEHICDLSIITTGKGPSFKSNIAIYKCIADLFKALRWRDHYIQFKYKGKEDIVLLYDHTKTLELTLDLFYLYWYDICRWSETHRETLGLLGVGFIRASALVNTKICTKLISIVILALGAVGVKMIDKTPIYGAKSLNNNQQNGKKKYKQYRRVKFQYLQQRTTVPLNASSSVMHCDTPTCQFKDIQIDLDYDHFLMMTDICIRKSITDCCKITGTLTPECDNLQYEYYIEHKNALDEEARRKIISCGTTIVENLKKNLNVPSYWIERPINSANKNRLKGMLERNNVVRQQLEIFIK